MALNHPLRIYLDRTGETTQAFADRSGIKVDTVRSYLARPDRIPTIDFALAIERATRGEVPVEAWEKVPPAAVGA